VIILASFCERILIQDLFSFTEEAQKTLEESMAMSIDERQELALELYRSRHGLSSTTALNPTGTIGRSKNGTVKKSSNSAATLGKSPPRPSPASVAYHSDEESLKCYDENPDDSSVTEKPSEVSSSDSQVCFHA
jgi:protein sidekick